jgi:hypothetical protein
MMHIWGPGYNDRAFDTDSVFTQSATEFRTMASRNNYPRSYVRLYLEALEERNPPDNLLSVLYFIPPPYMFKRSVACLTRRPTN